MTAYLHDPATGEPYNAETFDVGAYLARYDPDWFAVSEGRRELTRDDPLLFGVLYTPKLVTNADGNITFGDVHLGLYRDALHLRAPAGEKGDRRGYAAPRGSGKSTCLWTITNLWLACHHPQFVAAFSDTATQSEDHLKTIKSAMQTNALLRLDYPDACEAAVKPNGMPIADSQAMYYARNGFAFAARGIDTGVLGLVDPENRRPSVIMLDDIEGQEGAGYSLFQAAQRLKTITEGILPMNDRAHVRMIGTVHLAGGILDDMVKSVVTKDKPASWISEERFQVTYFEPLVTRPDGTRRSLWPGRWSVEYLESIESTRAYAKSFLNQPLGADGDFWTEDDITYGTLPTLTRRILAIDPATTTKRSSDRTGLAIVAYSPTEDRCVVEFATGVHLTGRRLADYIRKLIVNYPHRVAMILLEVNAGGELWGDILEDVPAKVVTHSASVSKEVRFAEVLDWYQKRPPRVLHAERFPMLEAEMTGFPKAANDDVLDACAAAIARFLAPQRRVAAGVRRSSYS